MNTKNKLYLLFSSIIYSSTFGSLLIANNNVQLSNINSNKNNLNINRSNNLALVEKKFPGVLIGAQTGAFTINYENTNNCSIVGSDDDCVAYQDFDFNGGTFTSDNITYKITRIDRYGFSDSYFAHFAYCNLTVPSTIKYIGEKAFYENANTTGKQSANKSLISINFKEGVEYIGKSAFESNTDIVQDTIKLPNSLKCIDNRAFVNTGALKYFDLTALDHVIHVECDPLSKNGCLPTHQIKKIYLKDEEMKAKYLRHKYWKSCAQYFEVIKHPIPDTKLTIGAVELGAKSGSITLDVADPNNCIILSVNKYFYINGDFDLMAENSFIMEKNIQSLK